MIEAVTDIVPGRQTVGRDARVRNTISQQTHAARQASLVEGQSSASLH